MVLILYYASILSIWVLTCTTAHIAGCYFCKMLKCTFHRMLGCGMLSIASVLIAVQTTSVLMDIRNLSLSLP